MVFLNADNDLDSFGVADQEEMAKVGSNDYLNVVCLLDRRKGPAVLSYIEPGKITPIANPGEVDMGDYQVLVRFVRDVAAAYPARNYALIVWNHGTGWDKVGLTGMRGVSYDESSGNHITTAQLGLAGNEIRKILGKKLDIFAFDACYLAMMEVAYVLRDTCDIVIASEDTEPGDGFPYDEILAGLVRGMNPTALAGMIVKTYVSSYSRGSQGIRNVCLSAIDCSRLDALKAALDGIARAAMAVDVSPQFSAALSTVQDFGRSYGVDLVHFAALAMDSIDDPVFRAANETLRTVLGEVILAAGNHGEKMKNANGLAVYFPPYPSVYDEEYEALAFARESLWDEMLQDYYRKSADAIVADVGRGDLSSLLSYARRANASCREISAYLTTRLKFRLFSDAPGTGPLEDTVTGLLAEIKTR